MRSGNETPVLTLSMRIRSEAVFFLDPPKIQPGVGVGGRRQTQLLWNQELTG